MKVGLYSNKNILVEGRIKKTDEKNFIYMIKSIFPRAQPINIKKRIVGETFRIFLGIVTDFYPCCIMQTFRST